MSLDATGLEAANERFYGALETGDLDAMERLWDHGDDVVCVHPGADVVRGWPRVRRSWAAVFASTDYLQFVVTDVTVRLLEGAGLVSCTENVLTGVAGGDLGGGRALATNVFVWDGATWRMVAHHASPVLRRLG